MTEYNNYIIKYQLHHEIITIMNIYHLLALKVINKNKELKWILMWNCKILPMNKMSSQVKISSGEIQIFFVINLIF